MTPVARLTTRATTVIVIATILTILALSPAARVELRADLISLLPDGSPSAQGYRVFLDQFGGLEKAFVVVSSDEGTPEDLIRASSEIERLLDASVETSSVRSGVTDADFSVFANVAARAPLLSNLCSPHPPTPSPEAGEGEPRKSSVPPLPLRERGLGGEGCDQGRRQTVARLTPEAIRDRARYLKAALTSPGGVARIDLLRADPLGFSDDLALFKGSSSSLPIDAVTGAFLAEDDRALVMLTPARAEIDPAGGRALQQAIGDACAATSERLQSSIVCDAVGGPLYAAQDEALLRVDLQRTITGSLVATSLILVAAFGGLWIPGATLLPLLAGLVWTAGLLGLGGGGLSAITLGFGAVLIGLGIDYGIHAGARFRERLRETDDAVEAIDLTVRRAGPGILTSALTTAAAFSVLSFAHLRALRELGGLVALGILMILLASATLGACALKTTAPRLRSPGRFWRMLGAITERASRRAGEHALVVLTIAAALTLIGVWGLGRLTIDADLRLLRPTEHPAFAVEEVLAESFGLGADTATVIVRGDDLSQALQRAAAAGERLAEFGDATNPADVLGTIVDPARLAELPFLRAADDLERELRDVGLNPRAFAQGTEALRAFGRGEDPGPPPRDQWPDWLSESVRETDDGAWIAISLRLASGTWPDGPPASLREDLERVAPGTAIASAVGLGVEMRALAGRDVEALSRLALGAVALLVLLSFRGRPTPSLLAAAPVLCGSIWTLGFWALAGQGLDLFSLAILPILLGIGLDDGLHVVHHARGDGEELLPALPDAVRAAGHAILLTTLTTAAGFGSLLLSSIPALQRGGLLIACGVVACWATTIFVLPALAAVLRRSV